MTKVLVATALLALGASFTSMAAAKTGTWMLEDDGWYCYDKEGEAYEDEFCLSYGKEYYVGDDGVMVANEWVEYDEATFYVGSDGSKTINDWRYLVPQDADEDEDAEWFYFDGKGKMVTSKKKVIDGKTYYFADNGVMLTGWVNVEDFDEANTTAGAVWCDENGARVSKEWVKTWAPGTDTEEAEEDDKEWYWIKSTGAVQTGRNLDINGQTYFFGTDGVMLSGWVAFDGTNYTTLDTDLSDENAVAVYFCGGADQGWAKKNTWIKTWAPEEYEDQDADNDQYWYYIAKSGKVFVPTEATAASAVTFKDGSAAVPFTATASNVQEKEINDKTYAFNEDGQMVSGLVMIDSQGMKYYGGSNDGAMKTGAIMIEDKEGSEYKFFFAKKTKAADGYKEGVGVDGAASGELFESGLIQTADNCYEEINVNGLWYIVDEDGDIRTAKKEYKDEDGNVLIDARSYDFVSASGVTKGAIDAE
jgi:glucan-binding YG repeat protein